MWSSIRSMRLVSAVLLAAMFFPLAAYARTPMTPDEVRDRVVKRGINNGIGVLEKNGLELYGKVLSIGSDRFVMQVLYAPQVTEVMYADVADLRTGMTAGEKTFLFTSLGVAAGLAIYLTVHFVHTSNDMKNQYNQQCAQMFNGVCPNPAAAGSGGGMQFRFGH